jgi:CTP synthase
MRLGKFDCKIKPGTIVYDIYDKYHQWKDNTPGLVSERHRHRYEFNNEYRQALEDAGMVISGTSPDDFFVETIELPKTEHPFFIATQAHPEYKSTPWQPHGMFLELLEQADKCRSK